ncbi:protein lifeguard 4 [Cephus cinctus]|uniref:Protein lifeguard 4 n=1 Tax=Cephus cinctus TaxID=211228 RepID=A0AAJ7BQR8_CEPCN|nr:protein lifeguard 4 [Cephus cinctus]XP_015592114.1 protein lifeguard 4 [Cephus cinctus]XP_015592115.1 protein lifeguard 4 [Cephus cinctus]XP_015592116.1 protein lifeguard 4 [Cephus cinctus]
MATVPLMFAEEDVEGGGKEEHAGGIQNDFAYNNNVHNANIKIRMAFLRKVYGLLSIQLLMTVIVAAIFMMCEPVKLFIQQNTWMVGASFFLTLGILIALSVKRKDHPANLILLSAFTLVQAYTVGVIVTMYDKTIVLEALLITLTVVIGLTAYTFQTKRDFSFMGFGLFAGLCVLLVGGLLQIFVQSTVLELAISIGGALLFSLFIVFDTQLLMHTLSPEEYILATINLYLDIINLFLHILRALAAAKQ